MAQINRADRNIYFAWSGGINRGDACTNDELEECSAMEIKPRRFFKLRSE